MKMQMKQAIAIGCIAVTMGCSKNALKNETVSNAVNIKLGTQSTAVTQAVIQPTSGAFFQSSFGNGVTVNHTGGPIDDITGGDIGTYDWVNTLEITTKSFDRFRINYESGGPIDRQADIVDDPIGGSNKCLRFFIKDAKITEEETGFTKGRVQADFDNLKTPSARIKQYYQKVRLIFDRAGFEALRLSDQPTSTAPSYAWLTMFEFWDEAANPANTYRISVNIVNVSHKLYWEVAAQIRPRSSFSDVASPGLTRRRLTEITTNNWQTIEIYIKQSHDVTGANAGRFQMAINGAIPIVDFTGRTCADSNTNPDGMEAWNPMKLYTKDNVVKVFKDAGLQMKVWWDDLEIRYKQTF